MDHAQTITTDIPCQNCKYNLRGLNQTGLCPECGWPIWVSVRSHFEPAASGRPYLVATLVGLTLILLSQLQHTLLADANVPWLTVPSIVAFLVGGSMLVVVVVGSVAFFIANRKRHKKAMMLALAISIPIVSYLCVACCLQFVIPRVH